MKHSFQGTEFAPTNAHLCGRIPTEEDIPVVGKRRKNNDPGGSGAEGSEKGQLGVPPGWVRQGFQLPKALALVFRAKGSERGYGGLRDLATAGIALTLGMPEHARRAIILYCINAGFDDPAHITPEGAWDAFVAAINAAEPAPGTPRELSIVRPPVQKAGHVEEVHERLKVLPPKKPDGNGGRVANGS